MEHKTCNACGHYIACLKGVLSTKKDIESVAAEYCPAFSRLSLPPCEVGDTLYRRWTCGGKETVAKFTVTRVSNAGAGWEIEYQSIHSAKWSRPVIRRCFESDIGHTIFLSEKEM